jgi:MoxR-like ATPase
VSPEPQPITEEAREAVKSLLDLPTEVSEGDLETYEISSDVADAPLDGIDIATLSTTVIERIHAEHLVFPDAAALVEQAVVALVAGNLVLHGPPGTGKTRLATLLAETFRCELHIETGTPDWSTYDVIGGLRPARDQQGREVLRPWLGHVPRAALRCAVVVKDHLASGTGPQAHWLAIDELSRADIDKAVGPLYTALSARTAAYRKINLWFEDAPQRAEVTLPERFRLLGTMNDVDTAFVTQLSQGLQRRFDFVAISVPAESQIDEELDQVSRQAAKWYGQLYGHVPETELGAYAEAFVVQPRIQSVQELLKDFIRFLRWGTPDGPRWPVGSGQLADVMRRTAVRAYGNPAEEDLTGAIDVAISNQLIPQTSALTREQLYAIEQYLAKGPLQRALTALRRVREPHVTHSG